LLLIVLLCGVISQAPTPVPMNQAEEDAILFAVLSDPWLREFGPEYVVVARKTAIPVQTPWLRQTETKFTFERDGSDKWAEAPVELLQSVKDRNKRSMSLGGSVLPSDGRWCRGSGETVRSCIIVSRPGVTSDGQKAAVAVLAPNLSGWTAYLERRSSRWQVVGRGFLFAAG
jgi:hypothetical protein